MPRTLKRRSDALSTADDPPLSQRRRLSPSPSPSPSAASSTAPSPSPDDAPTPALHTLSKSLVRYALSASASRHALRRADIVQKILRDPGSSGTAGRVPFKTVFGAAQETLRTVFGMEMVDLLGREKGVGVGLKERRRGAMERKREALKGAAAADVGAGAGAEEGSADEAYGRRVAPGRTQAQRGAEKDVVASAQSWVLVSTLEGGYRERVGLLWPDADAQRVHEDAGARAAVGDAAEETYTGLTTLVIALIYLTPTDTLSTPKLERHLRRLGVDAWLPIAAGGGSGGGGGNSTTLEKGLARMVRDGYLERVRGEGVDGGADGEWEWVVGPRGKREVGEVGVAGLVREVYGWGVSSENGSGERRDADEDEGQDEEAEQEQRQRSVKIEKEELERRLKRSLPNAGIGKGGAAAEGTQGGLGSLPMRGTART